MAIKLIKKDNTTSWKFATKAEALKKLETLKNQKDYEIVRNRENGKLAKGWILRKSK